MGLREGLQQAVAFTKAFIDGFRGCDHEPKKRRVDEVESQNDLPSDAEPVQKRRRVSDESTRLLHPTDVRRSTTDRPQSLPAPPAFEALNLKHVTKVPPKPPAPSEIQWKSMLAQARTRLKRVNPRHRPEVNKPPFATSTLPGMSQGPTMDAFFAELKNVSLRHVEDSPLRLEERPGRSLSSLGRRRTASDATAFGGRPTVPLPKRTREMPGRASLPASLHPMPTDVSPAAPANAVANLPALARSQTETSTASTPAAAVSSGPSNPVRSFQIDRIIRSSPALPSNVTSGHTIRTTVSSPALKSAAKSLPKNDDLVLKRPRSSDILSSDSNQYGTRPKRRGARRDVGSSSQAESCKQDSHRNHEFIRAPAVPTGKENAEAP